MLADKNIMTTSISVVVELENASSVIAVFWWEVENISFYLSKFIIDLENHETICQIEQFSRGNDNGEELYGEDYIETRGNKKFGVQDPKVISKRRQEVPRKQEIPKKKLTKLSDINSGNSLLSKIVKSPSRLNFYIGSKTQEEADEELAREMNK